MKAKVAVIQFPGVNCEYETVRALESAGLAATILRWNAPLDRVRDAAAIVLPGGFSYQDRIRGGVVAAKDAIMDEVAADAARGVPVMGICNGAQIPVEAGIVPGFTPDAIDIALAPNKMPDRSGYFCTWVRLIAGPARCIFTEFMRDRWEDAGTVPIPVAHAEGNFTTASKANAERLERGEGVALVYAETGGNATLDFPHNPNGAMFGIAGLTNGDGNVLALMPHPERATWLHQVPTSVGGSWGRRRTAIGSEAVHEAGPGRGFFESLGRGLGR